MKKIVKYCLYGFVSVISLTTITSTCLTQLTPFSKTTKNTTISKPQISNNSLLALKNLTTQMSFQKPKQLINISTTQPNKETISYNLNTSSNWNTTGVSTKAMTTGLGITVQQWLTQPPPNVMNYLFAQLKVYNSMNLQYQIQENPNGDGWIQLMNYEVSQAETYFTIWKTRLQQDLPLIQKIMKVIPNFDFNKYQLAPNVASSIQNDVTNINKLWNQFPINNHAIGYERGVWYQIIQQYEWGVNYLDVCVPQLKTWIALAHYANQFINTPYQDIPVIAWNVIYFITCLIHYKLDYYRAFITPWSTETSTNSFSGYYNQSGNYVPYLPNTSQYQTYNGGLWPAGWSWWTATNPSGWAEKFGWATYQQIINSYNNILQTLNDNTTSNVELFNLNTSWTLMILKRIIILIKKEGMKK